MHIIRNANQIYRHVDTVHVNGGNFVSARNAFYKSPTPPLEVLYEHCVPGALLDSDERFDPPKCDENTRVAIIQKIMEWIVGGDRTPSILWLHGPAGAGKSAIAQTISQMCKDSNLLAAAFFFSRNYFDRSNGKLLIATLVHQIASTFPQTRRYIEKSVRKNMNVFERNIEAQAKELLVVPMQDLRGSFLHFLRMLFSNPTHPRLLVVDGLDECNDPNVQVEILKAIAECAREVGLPFRFLIASRPESHICQAFDHHPSLNAAHVTRLDLVDGMDTEKDIRTYLDSGFKKITDTHSLRKYIPSSWPEAAAIKTLVTRASGQFIYVSTIMNYIQSPKHRPTDRLEVILGLTPKPLDEAPYASLDSLYTHIFLSVDDIVRVKQIFSLLVIPRRPDDGLGSFDTPEMLDKLLFFKPGDTELMLSDLLSIIKLVDRKSPVRLHHASLGDFLLDPSRSGPGGLFVDLGDAHERLARGYLGLLTGVASAYPVNSEALKSCLTSFLKNYDKATLSQSLMRSLETFPLIPIFLQLSVKATLNIPKVIARTMKATDTEAMQSFWQIRNFWRSKEMGELLRPFTRKEIEYDIGGRISNYYGRTLNGYCPLDSTIKESLDLLLSQPRFRDYVFRVCDHTDYSLCQRCQNLSELAPVLSYRLMYTVILYQPTVYSGGLIKDDEVQFGAQCARRAYVCLVYICGIVEAVLGVHQGENQSKNPRSGSRKNERREKIKARSQVESCADFYFEASLDCAGILLSYSDYSKNLVDLLSKADGRIPTIDQDYTLLKYSSQYDSLQSIITAYLQRVGSVDEC